MTNVQPLQPSPGNAGAALDAQPLLDAMDGVVYAVSVPGDIIAVGRRNWRACAGEAVSTTLDVHNIIGRNFFEMIAGETVKDAYRGMHAKLARHKDCDIRFEYRCDAADTERQMLMSMSRIEGARGLEAILYQSQILHEKERVPMMLFSPENYCKTYTDDQLVSLCSYCHDVAWPVGARRTDREWIKPEMFYARGGPTEIVLSHGICPQCYAKIVAPNIADDA